MKLYIDLNIENTYRKLVDQPIKPKKNLALQFIALYQFAESAIDEITNLRQLKEEVDVLMEDNQKLRLENAQLHQKLALAKGE